MKYTFNLAQQITVGIVSFLTTIIVTQIFDGEFKLALAFAVGLGTFFTSGFYKK